MSFEKKYTIKPQYLTVNTKRRSGQLISPAVKFIVAHDTGNPESTAANNVNYFENSRNKMHVSAHIFVDDKEIIECIPALTSENPEKAWHVRYQVPTDNELYNCNANDAAIGIEYCYGDNINADEAYQRYIWVIAYTCCKFKLDPKISIVGHHVLDPGRKFDPTSGLRHSKRGYEQLLKDVVLEYTICKNNSVVDPHSITNPIHNMLKLIRVNTGKVYAIGKEGKKHWILNQETLAIGREMGLWTEKIEDVQDDPYEEGHVLILVKH